MDKAQHVALCAGVVVAAYLVLCRVKVCTPCTPWPARLAVAEVCALIVGGLKELGDALGWWRGQLSYRDAAADLLGCALSGGAVALFEQQHWRSLHKDYMPVRHSSTLSAAGKSADLELGLRPTNIS